MHSLGPTPEGMLTTTELKPRNRNYHGVTIYLNTFVRTRCALVLVRVLWGAQCPAARHFLAPRLPHLLVHVLGQLHPNTQLLLQLSAIQSPDFCQLCARASATFISEVGRHMFG